MWGRGGGKGKERGGGFVFYFYFITFGTCIYVCVRTVFFLSEILRARQVSQRLPKMIKRFCNIVLLLYCTIFFWTKKTRTFLSVLFIFMYEQKYPPIFALFLA